MKHYFEELYKSLMKELSETEKPDDCFHVAMEYWLVAKEIFNLHQFKNQDEEPEFFRTIKPLFTSYIEYYLIVNQSLLFTPKETESAAAYWEEEFNRYKRFCDKHRDFLSYYESYSSENDNEYFTRRNNRQEPPPQERIYDDADCRSSHDHIVRGLLAHSMYHEFVSQQLQELISRKST
jgi:hypothetical protein